ncbi:hypothetical protein UFOVP1382_107 [uncultured Caudovirales phage]|uniref:Uncharacterized protein n=1 Tax=uncultured Caudovirales phage TaxID=2100421 RepID=A0A6J5RXL6_9CAUD|nr:hypothetical protein UFOVP1382_107 [uncultured Caudovirales phage]
MKDQIKAIAAGSVHLFNAHNAPAVGKRYAWVEHHHAGGFTVSCGVYRDNDGELNRSPVSSKYRKTASAAANVVHNWLAYS